MTRADRKLAKDESRNGGLDVARAVAILAVIAHHWGNAQLAAPAGSKWDDIFVRFAGHGDYGVTLFFLLSGFLIMRTTMIREPSLCELPLREFYIRRIARIQPLFLAVVGLGLAVLWWGGDLGSRVVQYTFHDPKAVYGGEFLGSLLGLSYNWEMILHRDEFQFRGLHWDVMWSLAVEEQFYLLLPLLLIFCRGRKWLVAGLLGVVAVGIATQIACDALGAGLLIKHFNSFSCFGLLALGVLGALFVDRLPMGYGLGACATAIGMAAILTSLYRGGVVPLILGGLLFIHAAHHAGASASWGVSWIRPLARIGQLSYGLYLLHAAALYLAAPLLTGMGLLPGFVLLTGIAFVLAEISDRVFETPANRYIRARFLHPGGAAAIPLTVP